VTFVYQYPDKNRLNKLQSARVVNRKQDGGKTNAYSTTGSALKLSGSAASKNPSKRSIASSNAESVAPVDSDVEGDEEKDEAEEEMEEEEEEEKEDQDEHLISPLPSSGSTKTNSKLKSSAANVKQRNKAVPTKLVFRMYRPIIMRSKLCLCLFRIHLLIIMQFVRDLWVV